ncbi:MAG: hypothetical protein IK082_06605 [Oscillospiraceae bacterium]|nr:hypothetical protein [Oscillospiraceae bacterium]
MKIDERRKAAESGETLPESALDAVSGGAGETQKKTVVIERDTGADAGAHPAAVSSGNQQSPQFRPVF